MNSGLDDVNLSESCGCCSHVDEFWQIIRSLSQVGEDRVWRVIIPLCFFYPSAFLKHNGEIDAHVEKPTFSSLHWARITVYTFQYTYILIYCVYTYLRVFVIICILNLERDLPSSTTKYRPSPHVEIVRLEGFSTYTCCESYGSFVGWHLDK